MSKTVCLYHIVINTHGRFMTIANDHREDMYRFIWKIIEEHNCHLYRIGGIQNHIHMLVNVHPTMSLADLVRDIKSRSSDWGKKCGLFPDFSGWGKEYGAFTVSFEAKDSVIEYIKSQQEHHKDVSFEEEYRAFVMANGGGWNDNMLT